MEFKTGNAKHLAPGNSRLIWYGGIYVVRCRLQTQLKIYATRFIAGDSNYKAKLSDGICVLSTIQAIQARGANVKVASLTIKYIFYCILIYSIRIVFVLLLALWLWWWKNWRNRKERRTRCGLIILCFVPCGSCHNNKTRVHNCSIGYYADN